MNQVWYRSRSKRMLGGVAGGLSEYLEVDVTVVRLFFVVSAMASGLGVVLYMILWLITQPEGAEEMAREEAVRVGLDEMQERASELTQELGTALEKDDPQKRMIVRWALAILIGLAANRIRASRMTHRDRGEPCKPEPKEEVKATEPEPEEAEAEV